MPVSRVARSLGSRFDSVCDRAQRFRTLIPADGLKLSSYVEAVLHDVDPASINPVLKLLHARKLVWVRRLRGDVRLYASRPSSILLPKDERAYIEARLCAAVSGHMLSLSREESARRRAQDAGDDAGARENAEASAIHAVRALTIIRQHHSRGLRLDLARTALHDAFAEPAVAAVVRRESRLSLNSTADDLDEPKARPRAKRIPSGLPLNDRVFKLIERSGARGATRTDLANAIRPKPKAQDLDDLTTALEDAGLIVSSRIRLHAAGQPGMRFFTAAVGLPDLGGDGLAVIPLVLAEV